MTEDRKQLVQTLLDGGVVPRVPVGFWWHYFSTPPLVAAVQSRMQGPSKVPPGVIWKVMPRNSFRGYVDDRVVRDSLAGHKRDYEALQPDL